MTCDEEPSWVIIGNSIYDVTDFDHPGGDVLYTYRGEDATDVFSAFHANATYSALRKYKLGTAPKPVNDEIARDFRELRAEFLRKGLFRASLLYYATKSATTAGIGFLSVVLLWFGRWVESAFVMGLFWQQCGWLSHDFVHHQVFVSRWKNDVFGYMWGNLCQGFSVSWWKSKHNTHHAKTNQIGVDPDIDTLPLLAWSETMISESTWTGFVRHQFLLFFPLVVLSRFSWCVQSFVHALFVEKSLFETCTLALHYAWVLCVAFAWLPWRISAAWFLLAQIVSGVCLSMVFVQSHNGMEMHESQHANFYVTQVLTTRDITGSFFGWFSGGLHLQIEHHMFPTMPRHNLWRCQARVKALCQKHGLFYEECGFFESTVRVLGKLRAVAAFVVQKEKEKKKEM